MILIPCPSAIKQRKTKLQPMAAALVHPVLLCAHNGKMSYFVVLTTSLKWETLQKIGKRYYLHFFYCLLFSNPD